MNKKTVKIISTMITIVMMLMFITPVVFAADLPVTINPQLDDKSKLESIGNNILGWISGVGSFIAVGVLMVLGIKYMMGSAEEKASYKKTMVPYVVGACLIFAATTIVPALFTTAQNLLK